MWLEGCVCGWVGASYIQNAHTSDYVLHNDLYRFYGTASHTQSQGQSRSVLCTMLVNVCVCVCVLKAL